MSWWNPLEELAKDLQGGFSLDNLQSDAPQEMKDISSPSKQQEQQEHYKQDATNLPPTSPVVEAEASGAAEAAPTNTADGAGTAKASSPAVAPVATNPTPAQEEEEDEVEDDIDGLLPTWTGTKAAAAGPVEAGASVFTASPASAAAAAVAAASPPSKAMPGSSSALGTEEKRKLETALHAAHVEVTRTAAAHAVTQSELMQCQEQLRKLQSEALQWHEERQGLEMQLLSSAHEIQANTVDHSAPNTPSAAAITPPTPSTKKGPAPAAGESAKEEEKEEEKVVARSAPTADLEAQVRFLQAQLQTSTEAHAVQIHAAQAQATQHSAALIDLTAEKRDIEGKNEQLASKMRDLAKVYGECKKKLSKALGDLQEAAGANKGLQEDLQSMQNKYAETRKNSLAATETYSEEKRFAQSRIAEQKTSLETLQGQVAELQERLRVEKSSLTEALQESSAMQMQEVKAQAEKVLKEYIKKMHVMEEEHVEALMNLQDEVRALNMQSSANGEVAAAHEEYKKRAQLALKKANTSASEKTAEVEALHKELEESRAETATAVAERKASAAALKSAKAEQATSAASAQTAQESLQALSVSSEAEREEWSKEKTALEARVKAAQKEIFDLRHAVAASAAAGAAHSATPAKRDESTFATERTPVAEAAAATRGRDTALPKTPAASQAPSTPRVTSPLAAGSSAGPGTHAAEGEDGDNSEQAVSTKGSVWVPGGSFQGRPGSPSSGNGSGNSNGNGNGNLFYAQSLKAQVEEVRQQLSSRGLELEELKRALQLEKASRVELSFQREELLCFIDRSKQASGEDSSVNMEYLKNCIMRYMGTFELSEKKRLFPVIATVMKLTKAERDAIEDGFERQEKFMLADGLSGTLSNTMLKVRGFWGKS